MAERGDLFIGAAGFLVRFMFVCEPALLMIGSWPLFAWSFVSAVAGIVLFAGGLHGYFVTAAMAWQRVLLVGAGFCLVVICAAARNQPGGLI